MRSSLRVAALCTALVASFAFVVPVAGASVKASAALVRAGGALQLEVSVSSTKAFTAATRPKSVKVGSVSLKRTSSGAKQVVFRSGALTAGAATKLAGSRPAIRVKSRAGTRTLRATVTPAPPETPTGAAPAAPGGAPTAPNTPPPSAPNATRNDDAGRA